MPQQGFYNHKKQLSPICLLAQNTMNTKSEDVVKNVESNNVELTSNEQRQTAKPIVISRRRLLKAGVAGIPVVLTMVGIAPAAGIQTEPSAASGLIYGGNKVYNRFAGDNTIERDGLIWTDHNGFVLQSAGGVKTEGLTVTTDTSSSGETTLESVTVDYTGGGETPSGDPPSKSFKATITPPTSLTVNAYLHKTGEWYTDRIVRTGTPTDLLEYIKGLTLTVKDGSNTVTANVTVEDATFKDTVDSWIKTTVQGYSLVEGSEGSPQNYYLLPASDTSIDSVYYNAKVSFTYTVDGYTYTCNNQTVQIPLKLNVTNIPSPTNDDHGI